MKREVNQFDFKLRVRRTLEENKATTFKRIAEKSLLSFQVEMEAKGIFREDNGFLLITDYEFQNKE